MEGKSRGDKAIFGKGGVEYVALVGLRADEPLRVARVRERNQGPESMGYEGEHVYTPLADMSIGRDDVNSFWTQQDWDLELPKDGALSNCVYCFLKGLSNLRSVHEDMEVTKRLGGIPGYGSTTDTPCDIAWWNRMEQSYGRDLKAEGRQIRTEIHNDFLGFFGVNGGFSYELLSKQDDSTLKEFADDLLPCDCTD